MLLKSFMISSLIAIVASQQIRKLTIDLRGIRVLILGKMNDPVIMIGVAVKYFDRKLAAVILN